VRSVVGGDGAHELADLGGTAGGRGQVGEQSTFGRSGVDERPRRPRPLPGGRLPEDLRRDTGTAPGDQRRAPRQ
jgi:hypothetical protein